MRALPLLFAIIALPLAAAGCLAPPPQGCTEIGCADGLTISLKKASGSWEPGMYSVEIDADGKKIACTTQIPLSGASPSSCDDAAVLLGTSGSALPASEHGLSDLIFHSAPKQVSVTVSRDGAMLATKDFTPTYQKSQPNGPDCEPICNQASDSLPVP
jgi:hypothetical protein